MANVIIDISPNPTTITSGAVTALAISYIADQGGTLELRTSAAFTLDPTSMALPATPNGAATMNVTIIRTDPNGPTRCDIVGTFAGSAIHTILRVT
jgi:hypothetical protein